MFVSGVFYVLNQEENFSFVELLLVDKYSVIYLLAPALAFIVTLINMIISVILRHSMFNNHNSNWQSTNFLKSIGKDISMSVEVLVMVPATILFAAFSSAFERKQRLLFVYPATFTVFCVFIPTYIICKNRKMKYLAWKKLVEPLETLIQNCISNLRKKNSRKIIPVNGKIMN